MAQEAAWYTRMPVFYVSGAVRTTVLARYTKIFSSAVRAGFEIIVSDAGDQWAAEFDVADIAVGETRTLRGELREVGSPLNYVTVTDVTMEGASRDTGSDTLSGAEVTLYAFNAWTLNVISELKFHVASSPSYPVHATLVLRVGDIEYVLDELSLDYLQDVSVNAYVAALAARRDAAIIVRLSPACQIEWSWDVLTAALPTGTETPARIVAYDADSAGTSIGYAEYRGSIVVYNVMGLAGIQEAETVMVA